MLCPESIRKAARYSASNIRASPNWITISCGVTSLCLPERGRIGIFNRSYYGEVLIVRVHPDILRSQGLPVELIDEKRIWQERCHSIVDLESHLYRNGTRVIKFFLHLSKEELRKRIDEPEKKLEIQCR